MLVRSEDMREVARLAGCSVLDRLLCCVLLICHVGRTETHLIMVLYKRSKKGVSLFELLYYEGKTQVGKRLTTLTMLTSLTIMAIYRKSPAESHVAYD